MRLWSFYLNAEEVICCPHSKTIGARESVINHIHEYKAQWFLDAWAQEEYDDLKYHLRREDRMGAFDDDTSGLNLPVKHCYWVVQGKFIAGEYPRNLDEDSSLEKIGLLLDQGVKVFIDLTEEYEPLLPYATMLGGRAIHKRFPIRDASVPASTSQTVAIIDTIDAHLARGELVYVHCWGGIGRTGTIVGCWLARHGLGGEGALDRLRELWQQNPKSQFRNSPETQEQERYILNWEIGK